MYRFSYVSRGGKNVKVLTSDPVVLGSPSHRASSLVDPLPLSHWWAGGPPWDVSHGLALRWCP